MGFLSGLFKKHPVEQKLEEKGADVGQIKKLFSQKDYRFMLEYLENLDEDFECKKSPCEMVTPIETFIVPLIIETSKGYITFLPALKAYDDQALKELIVYVGFIKKYLYFNTKVIICNSPNLTPSMLFFSSRDVLAGLFLILYVDSTLIFKDKSPILLMVENFQHAFHKKLEFTRKSLIVLDEAFTQKRRPISREVLESEPAKIFIKILHSYLEKVFIHGLNTTPVESGKVRTGRTYLLFKTIVFVVDFTNKIRQSLKDSGKFNITGFYDDARKMTANPRDIPGKDSLPFLEWRILTEEIRHITRPLPLMDAMKQVMKTRYDEIQRIGPRINDGWVDLYFCKNCNMIQPRNWQLKDRHFHTLAEIKNRMLDHITYGRDSGKSGESCSTCGIEFPWSHLIFSQFQHYIADMKIDLELNYDRLPSGHIYYMWQSLGDDKIMRRLNTDFTDTDFNNHFSRYLSAAVPYNEMMVKAVRLHYVQNLMLEEHYHVYAVPPPIRGSNFIDNTFRQMTDPLLKSGRNFRAFSLNVPKKGEEINIRDGFLKWAPDFRKQLLSGEYQLIAFIDVDTVQNRLENEFIDTGIIFHVEDGIGYVDNGRYRLSFNLMEHVSKMIHEAYYSHEYIFATVGNYIKTLDRINELHNWLNEQYLGRIRIELDRYTGVAEITNVDESSEKMGASTKFNLYSFVDRLSTTDLPIVDLIERTVFEGKPHSKLCPCGNPASMAIRLSSKDELEKMQQEAGEDEIFFLKDRDLIYTFRWGCPEHYTPLTNNLIEQLGLTNQLILSQVLEDIDYDPFRIKIFIMEINDNLFAGVTGENAATLGTNALWVKRVLTYSHLERTEDQVNVYSDASELLVITNVEASAEDAALFARGLREREAGEIETFHPLMLYSTLSLPSEGGGEIHVTGFEEKM